MLLYPFEEQLDLPLAPIQIGDGSHQHAEVAGAGIQGIDRFLQVDTSRRRRASRLPHRIDQGVSAADYAAADAHLLELACLRAEPCFAVAQAFAVGDLCERHGQVLIQAGERFDFVFAIVTRYAATQRRRRRKPPDLREHRIANVHQCPPAREFLVGSQMSTAQLKSRPEEGSNIYSASINCKQSIDQG